MFFESVFETSLSFNFPTYCKRERLQSIMQIKFLLLQVMCEVMKRVEAVEKKVHCVGPLVL